jgi:hypothetical protein
VGAVTSVDDQYVNQLPQVAQGVDFGLVYHLTTDRFGSFDLNADAAYLDKLFQSPTPGIQALLDARAAGKINAGTIITGASELVGQNGTPAWRGSGSLNWRKGNISANWFVNYVGQFYATGLTYGDGTFFKVPDSTFHNVSVTYEWDEGRLAGLRLRAGARNIFDKNPPLSPTGYVGAVYNPYARYWYVNVRKSF